MVQKMTLAAVVVVVGYVCYAVTRMIITEVNVGLAVGSVEGENNTIYVESENNTIILVANSETGVMKIAMVVGVVVANLCIILIINNCFTIMMGKVMGDRVNVEKKILQYDDDESILLHVPTDCVPLDAITITPTSPDDHILPKDYILISDVFNITTSHQLKKPIEIQLKHCVNITNEEVLKHLTFIKAPNNACHLKPCDGGVFTVGSQYGSLKKCWEFSNFGIAIRRQLGYELKCSLHLFYSLSQSVACVAIIKNLPLLNKSITKVIPSDLKRIEATGFNFFDYNVVITTTEVKNWNVHLLSSNKITKQSVEDCNVGQVPPFSKFQIEPSQTQSKNKLLVLPFQLKRSIADETFLASVILVLNPTEPQITDLVKTFRMVINWEEFAIHLPHIDMADIDRIKRQNVNDIEGQKMTLFDQWLKSDTSASWESVITALKAVRMYALVAEIERKYNLQQSNEQVSGTDHDGSGETLFNNYA